MAFELFMVWVGFFLSGVFYVGMYKDDWETALDRIVTSGVVLFAAWLVLTHG